MTIRRRPRRSKRTVKLAPEPGSVMPTTWDRGATGPANRRGLIEEPATDFDPITGKETPNPNGTKRARRVDLLEVWAKKGAITAGGYNAAVALRDAFEATQRAPGWPDNDRVQSSPKPDHAVAIQTDRLSAYHRIARLVPASDWPIIDCCVLHGALPHRAAVRWGWAKLQHERHVIGLGLLRDALDRLADAMAAGVRQRAGKGPRSDFAGRDGRKG